jgi:hypothetical protein
MNARTDMRISYDVLRRQRRRTSPQPLRRLGVHFVQRLAPRVKEPLEGNILRLDGHLAAMDVDDGGLEDVHALCVDELRAEGRTRGRTPC